MNTYPSWKYALLALIIGLALIYALPNLYGEDPAVQISPVASSSNVPEKDQKAFSDQLGTELKAAGIAYQSIHLEPNKDRTALIRFSDTVTQLKAKDILKTQLGDGYSVALNLAPATPQWLTWLGAKPMKLGLDLRGGVHFLVEVDLQTAIQNRLEGLLNDIRGELRDKKLRTLSARILSDNSIQMVFFDKAQLDTAFDLIKKSQPELTLQRSQNAEHPMLIARFATLAEQEIKTSIVDLTLVTLRNRINELGVAEAVAQRQGLNHIVVELPGIQDTARAKEILGKTATLEFLMHDDEHDVQTAINTTVPPGSKIVYDKASRPILLKKRIILSGDSITGASVSASDSGMPAVSVRVNGGAGLAVFKKVTRENIGKHMAVVFIESKMDEGKIQTKETLVSLARINSGLGNNFQITGLNVAEAQDLSLYLRAGALPATISIVEEKTVGPSLGQENIRLGMMSMAVGLTAVLLVMLIYYSVFGLIADIALCINVILLVAVLSLIGATLTLPGIAGIVLTVGMAVDANVLIFERIREELRNGMSAQAAIHSGFDRAFSTILDSNLTTLMVGIILFSIGSGPVRGFAVTLSIGIITSMFTAITVTRAIVNLVYGGYKGRGVQKLRVGI
jgi:preprotein translocase subunit SecD